MKKQKEETNKAPLDEDLEAFEEWEEGEVPGEAGESDTQLVNEEELVEKEDASEGGLDLPDFEEPEGGVEDEAEGIKDEVEASEKVEGPRSETEFATDPQIRVPDTVGDLTDLAPDVPVKLVAVIGKATTNVGKLMKMKVGSTVDLGRPPNETVDLVANGKLLARGELVEIDGKLGVKILKLVK